MVTIGSSDIKHPIITFQVNLDRPRNEQIGPNTNSKDTNLLHPDLHDNSPDRGRINSVNHDTQKISWMPGFLAGENIFLNDNGSITAFGRKATYLKDTYTTGPDPLLTILSNTFASA